MLKTLSCSGPSKMCLHMLFMAHMKSELKLYSVLGIGVYTHSTQVISRSTKAQALPVEERSSTHTVNPR